MSLIHSDTSIAVVAVGPGDSSLMTLQGREILENADVVVGFKTVLDVVRPWIVNADARDMTYRDQEEVLEYVESQALLGKKCVVCAWGDLNFSARELVARVRRRAGKVELTPPASGLGLPWKIRSSLPSTSGEEPPMTLPRTLKRLSTSLTMGAGT